jgi:hypothetical protein
VATRRFGLLQIVGLGSAVSARAMGVRSSKGITNNFQLERGKQSNRGCGPERPARAQTDERTIDAESGRSPVGVMSPLTSMIRPVYFCALHKEMGPVVSYFVQRVLPPSAIALGILGSGALMAALGYGLISLAELAF